VDDRTNNELLFHSLLDLWWVISTSHNNQGPQGQFHQLKILSFRSKRNPVGYVDTEQKKSTQVKSCGTFVFFDLCFSWSLTRLTIIHRINKLTRHWIFIVSTVMSTEYITRCEFGATMFIQCLFGIVASLEPLWFCSTERHIKNKKK